MKRSLPGLLAHESGHVVMRHGTHQASEALLAQAPLALLERSWPLGEPDRPVDRHGPQSWP